jgi:hypothetical protein
MSVHQNSSFLSLLLKYSAAAFCSVRFLFHEMVRNGIPRVPIFLFFVARKEIPTCVLFRGMVRNGIPRICIYFATTERNSELCSLPQEGSEQNYGNLLIFLFNGTEFRVVFSSSEGFGTEFRDFLFRGTTGIPSEITICSVYSVFRGIIFLSEIPNPTSK